MDSHRSDDAPRLSCFHQTGGNAPRLVDIARRPCGLIQGVAGKLYLGIYRRDHASPQLERERALTSQISTTLTPLIASRLDGFDGLRRTCPSLVPEIALYLADDEVVLQARMEAKWGLGLTPFWAKAWAGGQAVARYILDHPSTVAGRQVLDVGTGCGIAAIAAALAGAAAVTANDIDPHALAAVVMNAEINGVSVSVDRSDLLTGDGSPAAVVLVGDAFYSADLAERMQDFLRRCVARGALVLISDPDRGHLPADRFDVLAQYRVSDLGAAMDAQLSRVSVLGPAEREQRG